MATHSSAAKQGAGAWAKKAPVYNAAAAASAASMSPSEGYAKTASAEAVASNFTPSAQQADFFSWIVNGSGSAILEAVAGSGKCLGKDTPVLMFDGSIKAVQDVVTGDVLMGMNSDPKTVLSTTKGVSPLYKITPVKGDAWVCNDVHVLTLKQSVTKEVFDITLPDYLANQGSKKLHDAKQFRVGVEFQDKETICASYLLGIWLGDGAIAGPRISLPDNEVIAYLIVEAPKYGLTAKVTYPEGKCPNIDLTGVDYSCKTNILRDEFNTCVINNEKRIPSQYLTNSREKRLDLLAGLLDTDGYLDNGYFEIITKYAGLRDDILFLARSLGFAAYATSKVGTIKSLGFKGDYWRILISGHINTIPTKIARKKAAPRLQKKDVLNTGFRVDAIGEGDYYGFTLDGDGRFLLGDFTVTHNTTTLIEGLALMTGRVFFGAYNKKIADEIQARAKGFANVKISTMHSAGLMYLKRIAPNAALDYNKMRDIYRAIAGFDKQLKGHEAAILSLVSFAKQSGIGITCPIDDSDAWHELIDNFTVDTDGEDDVVIFNAIRTLKRSNDLCVDKIDFDDMIYYPLLKDAVTPFYDWVLIDEAQDTNATRRLLALRMMKTNARLVAVGDKHQAIYGFTGADSNSLDLIQSFTGAAYLPLSVSFRCPKLVVAEAQKHVSHIQAHPDAEDGIVRYLPSIYEVMAEAEKGDAILCRYNAPIVEMAYQFILNGKPAKIEGKDISSGLKALARKWNSTDFPTYKTRIATYLDKMVSKFKEDGKEYRAEALQDRVDCLRIIVDRIQLKDRPVTGPIKDAVCYEIDAIFGDAEKQDTSNCVLLSSIHKAKGMEWECVYYLTHVPSGRKMQDWEKECETNLLYVAATRSKHELVLAPLPVKTKAKKA